MEVVAEVVVSAALELVLEKLASSDSWKYVVGGRVRSELKKWESQLLEVREVLWDAENKQIRNGSVRKWLGQLRDLAYDMEDVLDEFGYHDQMMRRNDLMMMGAEADGSQVRRFFFVPSCCPTTLSTPMHNLKMGSKIEAITGRLEQISSERNKYGLDKVAAITQNSTTWQRPLNTSLVNESEVYGRDVDKKRIIDMLLGLHKEDDDPHPSAADQYSSTINNVFSVVSIVAMGGMGKTTLARLVYDDAEATKNFTLKAWACVSDQFDAKRVTRTILESIGVSHHPQDFNKLQEKLREELKGKKFLLVLDDVWTDDPNHWYCLRAPFSSASRGSKIIVTTRDRRVAEVMGSGDKNLHLLNPLSEEECWSVFKRHSNVGDQSMFASIGKQIVNKCDGLPLAARALGGLLFNQRRQEEWEAVLTSPIWELKESSIIPALRLSYNYLPPHLKRCFAYCALFPKDYEFNKEELILLWMAEGFFEQSNHQVKELEDLGDDYFLELVSKSFFQRSARNTSTFVMHDLIHDLAKSMSKETCLHLDAQMVNYPSHSTSKSVRHLSYIPHICDSYKRFGKFHEQSQLRTFMNIWLKERPPFGDCYISSKVLEETTPQFKCLRALSLRKYEITEIPNSFGDQLKHLRYLDLSYTHIQWLPDSIGNLFYLQTLKLSECKHLSKLPISIKNLMNLRHLDISGENKLEVPLDIHKLKNLRLLSNFIVGGNNGLSNLGSMKNLGGQLCISKLEEVVDIQDAGLISQQKLKSLIVKWSARLDGYLGKERNHLDVLRSLQPRTTLEQLQIVGYGGWEFPNWVGDASFSQMVNLTLEDCGNCTSLPCLGQLPSLKRLFITGMSGVKKVGAEFYGANNRSFPSLEYLNFKNMQGWEEWEDSNICLGTSKNSSFPCLQELRMRDCPNLTINIINLPTCLPRSTKLYITNCKGINNMEEEIMMRGGVDDHLIMTTNTTSLMELYIRSIPTLAKLDAGFVRGLRDLGILYCNKLTCLWDDDNDDGDELGSENLDHNSLDDDQMIRDQYCHGRLLGCNLRSLSIFGCGILERLPNGWHKTLTCLEDLSIIACPNLESFPEVGFPPKLRSLSLEECQRLKCLPKDMMMSKMSKNSDINGSNNSCVLEFLEISWCPSLISLEGGGVQLPTTLKTLYISNCDNLESLPAGVLVCAGLEVLDVISCPSLTGFPNNNDTSRSTSPSSTLKRLRIYSCENLKSLPEGIFMTEHDHGGGGPVLQDLAIVDCPSLQSFPEGMFPSTLEKLEIGGCGQLESISEEMFLHCSSSSSSSQLFLSLSDYPNLKAFPDHHGLSGALSKIRITSCKNLDLRPQQFQHFTRLILLEIRGCENIKTPLSQWGLTRLPSLKSLSIGGIFPDATSFSDHQQSSSTSLLLPTTLTTLGLYAFPNLGSIASLSLHQLCSLEGLEIRDCPKLRSILPRKKWLPPTLLFLIIETSPLLEKRYSKEKGKDWSKIAHIPCVRIT